ncbi:MAG: flagellar protein FlgN [Gammaproteobacteria bacterium]|nr:flagellar protein FlgN [Gammaproteobacteria bacterium]
MTKKTSNQSVYLAFGGLLIKQLKLSIRLLKCLNKEYDELKIRSLTHLQNIAEMKQDYLVELEQLTQSVYEMIEKNSYPVNRTGAEAFVNECEANGMQGVKKQWQNLAHVLKKCQKQNQVNGNIIHMSRKNIHHALNIIYNEPIENSSYEPSGQCVPKHTKRMMNVV